MRLALLPWVEQSGILRPDLPDGVSHASIDLRPFGHDGVVSVLWDREGALPAKVGRIDLGDDPAARLNPAARTAIGARLGTTVDSRDTLGSALAVRMLEKLRPDNGRYRIHAGGVTLYDQPVVAGGATDGFDYSSGNLATVSSGAWTTDTSFNPMLADGSSAAVPTEASSSTWSVAVRAGGAADHHSESVISASHVNDCEAGVVVRSNGIGSFYLFRIWLFYCGIYEYTAGSSAALTENFSDPIPSGIQSASPLTIRLTCSGSSLTGTIGGVTQSSTTDSTLTHTKWGIGGVRRFSDTLARHTSWAGTDDSGGASNVPATPYRRRMGMWLPHTAKR